ncbi:hypothetical protein ACFU8Q_14550 [Streptomyces sp. NPDC057543]|uniref:hypothetical protein n=1 Tax=Streptomyces sp. NPDC057543 TaxID=3346163 RepID=UPI00369A263F
MRVTDPGGEHRPERRTLSIASRSPAALSGARSAATSWLHTIWQPTGLLSRLVKHEAFTPTADLDRLCSPRRQHEHRARTADRLTAILDTGLLPAELTEMALYYQAKAHRDLGQSAASRDGMRQVADRGGRLAPDAARGLAHLARAAGDFPTALATAQTLGWPGRGHRVLGDIHFAHGNMTQAATAYTAARTEAEQHGNTGEQAIAQAHLALTERRRRRVVSLTPAARATARTPPCPSSRASAASANRCCRSFSHQVLRPVPGTTPRTGKLRGGGNQIVPRWGPNRDATTDLLHYLAELSALGDELANRARQCHQLIAEHAPG